MTLYAMTSLCSTAVPRSHGGCGERHDRPVKNGAPEKLWRLDCPACETELRDSPHWAPTISEIPETYDEKIQREDQEKRGQRALEDATSKALQKLENMPDAMAALTQWLIAQNGGTAPNLSTTTCPNGHATLVSGKFCGECGAPMVPDWAERVATTEPADTPPATGETSLEDKGLPELREIALSLGVKTARSKADQIKLIKDHFDASGPEE